MGSISSLSLLDGFFVVLLSFLGGIGGGWEMIGKFGLISRYSSGSSGGSNGIYVCTSNLGTVYIQ